MAAICPVCNGTGTVKTIVGGSGQDRTSGTTTCPTCGGSGTR